jgi:hypothetical protein
MSDLLRDLSKRAEDAVKSHKLAEADALWGAVVSLNANEPSALVSHAFVKEQRSQYRESLQLLERAVELHPVHRRSGVYFNMVRRLPSVSVFLLFGWYWDLTRYHACRTGSCAIKVGSQI